ncbi:MAG: hypothetical protein H2069_07070 [Legionella sp.]|nr:hypothetical protein [Legionella sp.]
MKTILLYPTDDFKKVKPEFFPLLEWYQESLSNNIWPSDWKKLQGFEPHDIGEYRINDKVRILYAIKIHERNKYVVVLSVDENHQHYIPKKNIAAIIDKQIAEYTKNLLLTPLANPSDKKGSYSEKKEEETSIDDSRKGLKGVRTLFEEPLILDPHTPKTPNETITQEDSIEIEKTSLDLFKTNKKISKIEKIKKKMEKTIFAFNTFQQKLIMEYYKNEEFNQLFTLSAALPVLLPLLKVMVEYIDPLNINIFAKNTKGKMAIELAKDSTTKALLMPLYGPAEETIQRLKDCQTSAACANSYFYYTEYQKAIKKIFELPPHAAAHVLMAPIFNGQNVLMTMFLVPRKKALHEENLSILLRNIALLNGELQNNIYSYRMEPNFHNLFQMIVSAYHTPMRCLVSGVILQEEPLLKKLQMIVNSILNAHIRESCKSQIILSLINNKFKFRYKKDELAEAEIEIDTLEFLDGCDVFPKELAYLKCLKNQHLKLLRTTLLTEYSLLRNGLKEDKEELIPCFITPSFGKNE